MIVEKKASGISLIQDLRMAGIPVLEWKIDKDKQARAWAAAPLLEAGRVWVPQKRYAEEVIEQCARFPMGAHDDLVDSTTQALLWVHEGWLVEHPEDIWQASRQQEHYRQPRKSFY